MSRQTRSAGPAESSPGQPAPRGASSTANNARGTLGAGNPGSADPARSQSPSPQPDGDKTISENMVITQRTPDHPRAVLEVIRRFLTSQGVLTLPSTLEALFPPGWLIGRTTIPVRMQSGVPCRLDVALPFLRAWNSAGEEFPFVGDDDWDQVSRLTAVWDPPVKIAAAILAAVKDAPVTQDDVLSVAQRAPQALEQLKKSGKEFKDHFQRLLDPVALRRSPEFVAVAQRYKAQLRGLIDAQQQAIIAARKATAAVNKCLGERDSALARLDPGYVPKRATAAQALAEYGIDLDGDTEMTDAEGVAQDAPADLDF